MILHIDLSASKAFQNPFTKRIDTHLWHSSNNDNEGEAMDEAASCGNEYVNLTREYNYSSSRQ